MREHSNTRSNSKMETMWTWPTAPSSGRIMKEEFRAAYELFLKEWGQEAQERMAIEEMSELIKELCKKIRFERDTFENVSQQRRENNIQNIKEEIADVLNMAEQLEIYYGTKEIEKIRKEKIERTLNLIKEVE